MNLATIGTSWITSAFIQAAKKSGRLNLHSVYSRSLEQSKEFARKHQAANFYTDLDEMLTNEEIDVIYIASPNSLHYQHAIKCLEAKKHVICEKPIFSNTKEYIAAYRCAEENNVFLFEAIRNIHTPNFHLLAKELHKVGKLRSASLNYLQYSSRYDAFLNGDVPNVFSLEFSGGALVDLGVYPLFMAISLFGKPNKIHYFPVKLRNGIDGNGTLILQYTDFTCNILCSKISHSYLPSEIHGEDGTILLDMPSCITNLEFKDHRSKTSTTFSTEQVEDDMVYEINDFINIMETNDIQEYDRLKRLSNTVLEITEEARRQNNILFKSEQEG
ncbi:oxidoreductase [Heyndrickxia shackletonii]|uniref:Oxidoreductase n=1 Tax=Heyndrickxia shackletonii TaxID=157838 RepID=A0A0Q3TMB4_9BACI|nr:Gfo/Idh/MocA family oxidoreductase [Heyndrickxia shackletonii]KQL54865.1 oxidoreductase [Heyndrickxia shackletonii]NEY99484.1 Gfo/Idh/MocA family oxidoreductase [Heyndrickxia shackletonii]